MTWQIGTQIANHIIMLLLRGAHRTLCSENYFGPGGLSAREIFQKVQESRQREAVYARQEMAKKEAEIGEKERSAAKDGGSSSVRLSEQELNAASSKQLRDLLVAQHVNVSDCFERSDLLARAQLHLRR